MIDVRGNGGGSSLYGFEIINAVCDLNLGSLDDLFDAGYEYLVSKNTIQAWDQILDAMQDYSPPDFLYSRISKWKQVVGDSSLRLFFYPKNGNYGIVERKKAMCR